DFTPAWQLTNMCRHSCSFPSGESAAAAAMLSLFILVPARFRLIVAMLLVPAIVLVSLNRVFMGAHFLSDVLIAWTLIIGLMIWFSHMKSWKTNEIDGWVRNRGGRLRGVVYVR